MTPRAAHFFFRIFIPSIVMVGLLPLSVANQKENYKDLISKAQNLSLQRDRLQACQILTRAIEKEKMGSESYQEMKDSLEALGTLFYTDQAQAIFAQGESLAEKKPKEAIEKYHEALKIEDGNVAILRALARAQLRNDDCRGAEATIKAAESYDSLSGEHYLLRLQKHQCRKDEADLIETLDEKNVDIAGVDRFLNVFSIGKSYIKKDFKKAKQLLSSWETQNPDYPEIYFWKWQISNAQGVPDKFSAQKYLQLCKGLTPRKRKLFNLDVDLCKNIDVVEAKLKNVH